MTWEYEYSIETYASKKAMWSIYSNIESWPLWDSGIENVSIDGDFSKGTCGKIKSRGQNAMEYKITFADSDKGFTSETFIDGLGATVKFIHTYSDMPDKKIKVTHHITLSCNCKNEMEKKIGESLSSGIQESMESLSRLAILLDKICSTYSE